MTYHNPHHLYHHHHYHYSFFQNKELKQFFFSTGIISFGQALISLFVPIYLYKIGYSIPKVIFFYFLISCFFLAFSYIGAKIVSKLGVKHSILWSTPFMICYFLGLNFLPKYPWLFFVLPILISSRTILYWYGFHSIFIKNSKKRKRGSQLSIISTISLIAAVIAPLIGGIIASQSFTLLYIIGSGILLLGTLPLFLSKEHYEKANFSSKGLFKKIFYKNRLGELISYSGYAIESIIGFIIWPIFLITILLTVEKTGLIVTLSFISSLISLYFIGKLADRINKVKLFKFGTLIYSFGWFFRIFANSAFKILIIDSYKNFSQIFLQIPWAAHGADLAIKEGYFNFIVRKEIIFRMIRVLFLGEMLGFFVYRPWSLRGNPSSEEFLRAHPLHGVVLLPYGDSQLSLVYSSRSACGPIRFPDQPVLGGTPNLPERWQRGRAGVSRCPAGASLQQGH